MVMILCPDLISLHVYIQQNISILIDRVQDGISVLHSLESYTFKLNKTYVYF